MKKPKKNYWEERSRMSNIPKLRFPEFSGEWEEKRLSDIASFSKGKGYTKNDLVNDGSPIILYGRMYTKYETVISDIDTFVNLQEGSIISKGGEIIVPASGETAEEISRASVVKDKGIILGGDLNIISLQKDKYNPEFFALTISSGTSQKRLSKLAQGKSVVHLHNEDLSGLQIKVPTLAEQQKIADFLSNVDSIIKAETKILNTLQKKKKALMQKLFTQKLRFKSDNGTDFPEWEERKLGEIAIFSKGSGYSKSDLVSSGTPVILYGRLYTKYETVISDVDTFVQEKKNSVISVGNEIIVPASGETAEDISRASVVKHNGIILGGDLNIIKVDLNHYIPEFIALCISNGEPKKRMAKLAQGKTIVHLHNSDLQQLIFTIPCKEEQQKIADCLSSLDSLIQTQQKVVTTWQQRKKALLQQMFI